MDNKRQVDIDNSLHIFGQHMRKVWEARHAEFEKNFAAFREAAREDVTQVQEPKIEPPEIGPSKTPNLDDWMKERTQGIEPPKIEPPKAPDRDGPDMDR